MAGLLAWAADVVGGGAAGEHHLGEDDDSSIPLIFTPEQLNYVQELDRKASSLSRSIQDLRIRLPPPDISQRLPDLHAHSLASNAALALQLSAHSSTKEQAQLREIKLQEENAEFERAISACENKIQDKLQESKLLQNKLKFHELIEQLESKQELNGAEKNLENELENARASGIAGEFEHPKNVLGKDEASKGSHDSEDEIPALLEKLENKKQELASIEETVQGLEERWASVQENALTQPSPVQREKILDKQLHGLIEQLESKQAQAEHLVYEIHRKETDLESLNGRSRALETSITEANAATRNRFGRSSSSSLQGYNSSGYIVDPHYKGGKSENLQRLMLFRSAFVLYIFALHVLVFIKISF